jgi:septum formation protein
VRLTLASASPRRAELLAAAGIPFELITVEVDERPEPGEDAAAYVRRLASAKAKAAFRLAADALVLGADTTVVVDGTILGKPTDDAEAAEMLRSLSGRWHDVVTGVALCSPMFDIATVERSRVRFLPLSEAEISWYVSTGEPRDKAGGYAVQGFASRFVDRIEGSYSNVVGLPVASVYQLLRQVGALPRLLD